MNAASTLPEYADWSVAAVRLLQGVVYSDDPRVWNLVLEHQTELGDYVGRLGLSLVVDETEGFAYLRQVADDQRPAEYADLPRLFRRQRLSYGATLLCVLLRERLHAFEQTDVDNERCLVETSTLLETWKTFLPAEHDDVRHQKDLSAALRQVEGLGFIRKTDSNPETWEIRRILKARLPAAELETLRSKLQAASREKNRDATTPSTTPNTTES